MNLAQALEHANAFSLPGLLGSPEALDEERRKNEESIALLLDAWKSAKKGTEPIGFDVIMTLADRNREICDLIGEEKLRDLPSSNLPRKLSDKDLVHAVATLQHRNVRAVAKTAGKDVEDLGIAFLEKPVGGPVVGFDIETTGTAPERGYILNMGLAFMNMSPTASPQEGYTSYFGIPEIYADKGVPLAEIHHITWEDVEGKVPFRKNREAQKALLATFKAFPLMAHNAAFEDAWLTLHLDGYAEARKAGKICVIDSRDICRRLDVEARSLPRESAPASLENWARRRKTLAADEVETHLGLDDVFLMLRTVQAEFSERNMFAAQKTNGKG